MCLWLAYPGSEVVGVVLVCKLLLFQILFYCLGIGIQFCIGRTSGLFRQFLNEGNCWNCEGNENDRLLDSVRFNFLFKVWHRF